LKQVSKELFKELEQLGLIDNTKNNSNAYTTCRQKNGRRKKKYVCENVLRKYEYIMRNKNKK
jgi:hypothetical protein